MLHEHQPMVTKRGVPIDPPDKGSAFSRIVAVILAILVASLAIGFQNTSDDLHRVVLGSPAAPPVPELTENDPAPGTFGSTDIMSRMYLKMRHFMVGMDPMSASTVTQNIDPSIMIDEDRVRAAMLSAEYEDAESALERLDLLEVDLALESAELLSSETHPLLTRDIRVLRTIYSGEIDTLEQADRDYLVTRYQLLGEAALTFGLDDDDPLRKPLITGALLPISLIVLVIGSALLIGLVLLIVGVVLLVSGRLKPKMHKPTRGGSVFLETYAVFVGAFLLYILIAKLIEHYPSLNQYAILILPAQWILLVTAFWGLVRGMNFSRWRHAIGLYGGRQVIREAWYGLLVYLASIPLFLAGALVTMLLFVIKEWISPAGEDEGIPNNQMLEIFSSGDTVTILLIFTLATIWAPLCEELIFRGALFRHLRGYLHWTLAGLVTAMLFAFMHSYGPMFVTPLIVLGFMFAFMRHWRGSLIAPMTAHFVHNFSVMTLALVVIGVIT